MSYGKQVDQYRKTAVTSASPLQLVIMLYDGALRFIEAGKQAMGQKDYFQQNKSIQNAQKIVSELMSCLDMQKGGEIAKNLFSIYLFVYNELIEANVNDNPSKLDVCSKILKDLRDTWGQLEAQMRVKDQETSRAA